MKYDASKIRFLIEHVIRGHTKEKEGPFTLRSIFGTARIKLVRVLNVSVSHLVNR